MTDKEKIKAYDEALEKAKEILEMTSDKSAIYTIFPELAESEEEKIRKWIIDDIRFNMNNEPLNNSEYRKKAEKAIDWLERQGEQHNKVGWTEHDRTMAFTLMRDVDQISFISKEGKNERIGWLNNLDEKFIHQPKQEWTEEDERMFNSCCSAVGASDWYTSDDKQEIENWLTSLKERINT